jgi:ribosomal protein S18 acetylase RimI-like enzyme
MIRLLEEISLGAWPAPAGTLVWDGWILRFGGGYTRRANSVQVLYDGTLDVEEKIRFCENEYRARKQRAIFKMTDAACPKGLDAVLEKAGYRTEARTSVQTRSLEEVSTAASPRVREYFGAEQQWLDAYARLNDVPEKHHPTLDKIIGAIASPMCCAMLTENAEPVACGMAVIQEHWVGLFDIVTAREYRRRGLSSELIGHLLSWAKRNNARTAYLQVMLDNAPALGSYRKLGFSEVYQYWYRVKE